MGAPSGLSHVKLMVFLPSLASAYTEPFPINTISAGLSAEEDHGRTSEEEEGVGEPSFDRQVRQMEVGWRETKGKKSQYDKRIRLEGAIDHLKALLEPHHRQIGKGPAWNI